MDSFATQYPYDSCDTPEMEHLGHAGDAHTFIYGATCPALEAWGRSLGFGVLLLGIATDPLSAVQTLARTAHGQGGMCMDDVQDSCESWNDWILTPVAGGMATSSGRIAPWGGTLRIELAPDTSARDFARRLNVALSPLEAARHAIAAGPARERCLRGVMPPVLPRFTRTAMGWVPASGIYRWSGPEDARYASRAVVTSLDAGAGDALFDLLAEGEERLRRPGG